MSRYFESHVTVEPVFDDRLDQLKEICKREHFHVADLLMKKRQNDSEERSAKDSFCTSRSQDYTELEWRMRKLIIQLKDAGFQIWRYKIEDAVLDSRYGDSLKLL